MRILPAVLLLLLGAPVRAQCPRVGFVPRMLGPTPGEREVPLNAHVSVDASGTDGGLVLERLDEAGAATPVPVDFQVVNGGHLRRLHGRLIPANALAPGTRYRVVWPGNGTSPRMLGSFTTGTEADRTARPFGGQVHSAVMPYDNSLASPCGECWQYDNGRVHLLFPDAGEGALYNVYDLLGDIAQDQPRAVTAFYGCGPTGGRDFQQQEGFFITQGRHQLAVRAVDRAGNLSTEAVRFDVWATCDNADGTRIPYCVDAGTANDLIPYLPEAPDAGELQAPVEQPKGCGCGKAAMAASVLAFALARRRYPRVNSFSATASSAAGSRR